MNHSDDSTPYREQIWLMVTDGPVRGLSCWSDAAKNLVVGRAQDCRLRVADPRMSREHFVATFSNDCWWIRDLASSNGTLVNFQRISEPVEVKSGDIVVAGDTRFKVVITEGGLLHSEMPMPHRTEDSSHLAPRARATIVD